MARLQKSSSVNTAKHSRRVYVSPRSNAREKTIADVLKLANDGSSNTSNREAAAEIISEIAKDSRGVECLKDFEDDLLPLAYFGTFDENASVAKCWESAWEELSGGGVGATGGGSAIGKHFPNLWKSFLKPHLEGSELFA